MTHQLYQPNYYGGAKISHLHYILTFMNIHSIIYFITPHHFKYHHGTLANICHHIIMERAQKVTAKPHF